MLKHCPLGKRILVVPFLWSKWRNPYTTYVADVQKIWEDEAQGLRNPYRRDTGEAFMVEWLAGEKKIKTVGYALWSKDAQEILRKSHFKLERLLGGYNLEEKYTKWSRRLIIIASKRRVG
jgi:intergrase/recombinase